MPGVEVHPLLRARSTLAIEGRDAHTASASGILACDFRPLWACGVRTRLFREAMVAQHRSTVRRQKRGTPSQSRHQDKPSGARAQQKNDLIDWLTLPIYRQRASRACEVSISRRRAFVSLIPRLTSDIALSICLGPQMCRGISQRYSASSLFLSHHLFPHPLPPCLSPSSSHHLDCFPSSILEPLRKPSSSVIGLALSLCYSFGPVFARYGHCANICRF